MCGIQCVARFSCLATDLGVLASGSRFFSTVRSPYLSSTAFNYSWLMPSIMACTRHVQRAKKNVHGHLITDPIDAGIPKRRTPKS